MTRSIGLIAAGIAAAPLRPAMEVVAATALTCVLLWLLRRLERVAAGQLAWPLEQEMKGRSAGEAVRPTRMQHVLRRTAMLLLGANALVLIYAWFGFVLHRFPCGRSCAESLRWLWVTCRVAGCGDR